MGDCVTATKGIFERTYVRCHTKEATTFGQCFQYITGRPPTAWSLDRVDQRRKSLNPHFQFVAALNRADAAGCAGQNHVAGQQCEIRRDETDEYGGFEDELLGVGVLAQLAVLEKLDA